MSTSISIQVTAPVRAPRGAQWLGQLVSAVQAYRVAARATREQRQRVKDAIAVRALAADLERSMPGMAADLRAAADRSC
jgi:hypothetical protein